MLKLRHRTSAAPEPAPVFDGRGAPLVCSSATERQLDDFGRGACHILALAMHERYGWPMRALGRASDEWTRKDWKGINYLPDHVYCVRDDGLPVDVYGLHASESAIQRLYVEESLPMTSVDVTEAEIRVELHERGYRWVSDDDMRVARRHVERLRLHELTCACTS